MKCISLTNLYSLLGIFGAILQNMFWREGLSFPVIMMRSMSLRPKACSTTSSADTQIRYRQIHTHTHWNIHNTYRYIWYIHIRTHTYTRQSRLEGGFEGRQQTVSYCGQLQPAGSAAMGHGTGSAHADWACGRPCRVGGALQGRWMRAAQKCAKLGLQHPPERTRTPHQVCHIVHPYGQNWIQRTCLFSLSCSVSRRHFYIGDLVRVFFFHVSVKKKHNTHMGPYRKEVLYVADTYKTSSWFDCGSSIIVSTLETYNDTENSDFFKILFTSIVS